MKLKSIIPFLAIICILQITIFAQTNEVLINQAKAAIEKTDYGSAMNSLDIIFKSSPNNEAALTQRARIYVRQGKFTEASADVAKVLDKNPKNYEALNVRGVIKRDRDKDLNGALADFNRAVEIKPDFYLAVFNVGITNRRLNNVSEAITAFNNAIQLNPNDSLSYANRGFLFLSTGRLNEAVFDYDKAISLDDKNDNYFSTRGYIHLRKYIKDPKLSLNLIKNDVEKSLLINPNNALALSIRSLLKMEDNDFAGAIADADKALQIDPKSFLSYMTKGLIKGSTLKADKTYDSDGKLEEFEKAYKIVPNDAWIKGNLKNALRQSSSPVAKRIENELNAAAVEKAKQKVAANPWDFTAYDELNDALSDANVDKKAFWENMLAQNPKNICAIRFLGESKSGNYTEMISFFQNGLSLYDGKNGAECAAAINFRIGREYQNHGQYNLAATYFDQAKYLYPNLKNLQNNIDYNLAEKERKEKEEAERKARLADKSSNSNSNGNNTGSRPTSDNTDSKKYPTTVSSEIQAAFDRAHSQAERINEEANKKVEEFNKSQGWYEAMGWRYKKEQEIDRIRIRAADVIRKFLKDYEGKLPKAMIDHMEEDIKKILLGKGH
ncbi:MAG: tetratricopeptide repeat protein [Pyrinomonadaceae bacterium]|nr:tetratricopeptide repeat protein [Pyrinomonadaceae bacterium]